MIKSKVRGHVTANAVSMVCTNGRTLVKFSVAMNDRYFDVKLNSWVDRPVQFIDVKDWRGNTDVNAIKKGDLVEVDGDARLEQFEKADGTPTAKIVLNLNKGGSITKPIRALKTTVPAKAVQEDGPPPQYNEGDDIPM